MPDAGGVQTPPSRPPKTGTMHGRTDLLEASGIVIVQFEWVWPVLALLLLLNTVILVGLQLEGYLRYLATMQEGAQLELVYIAFVLLYGASALQSYAVAIMWAAACLYVARQAQALKLVMLDTRLTVAQRCDRVTESSTRLVSAISTWSWSLGAIVLTMVLCDVLFVLTYFVALSLPPDEVGIGIDDVRAVRVGQASTIVLLTLHLLGLLVPPMVANVEVASLPATARCLLPGMQGWWWQPGSYSALWSQHKEDAQEAGAQQQYVVEMKVQRLREHLRELTTSGTMQSLNVSLGGVVVTGPLVAQVLTLTYSGYYAMLTYLTSIGHL